MESKSRRRTGGGEAMLDQSRVLLIHPLLPGTSPRASTPLPREVRPVCDKLSQKPRSSWLGIKFLSPSE